jgi:tetratricopeptide (TPR) repeat protein
MRLQARWQLRRASLPIAIILVLGGSPIGSQAPRPSTADTDRVIEQSRLLTLRGEWDRAADLLLQQISTASQQSGRVARLRTEYARVSMDRNFFHAQDREAASRAIRRAERAAKAAHDRQSLTDLLQYRGQILFSEAFSTGDFEAARLIFLEARAARQQLGDKRGLAETDFYIGVSFEQQKKPIDAEAYYRRSLALAMETGDRVMQSYAHRHLGGLDEEAGRLDSAYEHIQRSLALRREAGFKVGVPFAMLQLADFLARHKGEPEIAITLTEAAMDLAESSHSSRARFFAQLGLSRLELDRKRLQAAASHAERAVEAARRFGEPGDLKLAQKQLAEIMTKLQAATSQRPPL